MSFLPSNDLRRTVTFVSRGWEAAARAHLLSRTLVSLSPTNMAAYLATTQAGFNHFKRLHLSELNFGNPSPEESHLLETFISTASSPITELHLDYFPHRVGCMAPHVITLLKSCHNLKFLYFFPKYFYLKFTEISLPEGARFPGVTNLGISMCLYYSSPQDKFGIQIEETMLALVTFFPNLTKFLSDTLPRNVVEHFLSRNASIESISLKLHDRISPLPILFVKKRSIFLTRVEFKVPLFSQSDHYYSAILAMFSDRLEKLKLTSFQSVSAWYFDLNEISTISLPAVFSKLKCFEMGISEYYYGLGQHFIFTPGLCLKFGENFTYAKQFPTLEKIVVSKFETNLDMYNGGWLSEEEWFESWAGFLNSYFLRGEETCLTVREISLPPPPAKLGRFKLLEMSECPMFELVNYSDFMDRQLILWTTNFLTGCLLWGIFGIIKLCGYVVSKFFKICVR